MDKKEFEFLLKQGEGFKLEFKENFDSKNLGKEIVAFANTEQVESQFGFLPFFKTFLAF